MSTVEPVLNDLCRQRPPVLNDRVGLAGTHPHVKITVVSDQLTYATNDHKSGRLKRSFDHKNGRFDEQEVGHSYILFAGCTT